MEFWVFFFFGNTIYQFLIGDIVFGSASLLFFVISIINILFSRNIQLVHARLRYSIFINFVLATAMLIIVFNGPHFEVDPPDLVIIIVFIVTFIVEIIRQFVIISHQQEELTRMKHCVDNAYDHIIITDPNGTIIYANKAVETLTGYKMNEVLGSQPRLWGGLMGKDYYENMWDKIKNKKRPFHGELKNIRKSKQEYDAEVHIAPVLDDKNNIVNFIGIERDITREKNIDRMKTEFISIASHQLRTPLTAIKWYIEMLLNGDLGTLSEKQRRGVSIVDQSNKRMIELVNSLLNISRIESGRLIVAPAMTSIAPLIQEVIAEVEKKYPEKHIKIIFQIDPAFPEVKIDPKLIREVYLNLLTNAIKYSPEKSTVQVNVTKDENWMISKVQDQGYGIPLASQNRIFEKFFRASNVMMKQTEGNGLGLYFIKSIVDSSGGKIWFESEENKGTTFWFHLPLSGMIPHSGDKSVKE